MKKIITLLLMIMVVSIVACQPAKKGVACTKEALQCPDGSYVGRTGPNCEFTPCPNMPATGATSDATVDSVGNDINSVDNIDSDLNSDELSDLDSGLGDVENI